MSNGKYTVETGSTYKGSKRIMLSGVGSDECYAVLQRCTDSGEYRTYLVVDGVANLASAYYDDDKDCVITTAQMLIQDTVNNKRKETAAKALSETTSACDIGTGHYVHVILNQPKWVTHFEATPDRPAVMVGKATTCAEPVKVGLKRGAQDRDY